MHEEFSFWALRLFGGWLRLIPLINQAEHPQFGALLGICLVLTSGFIAAGSDLSDGQRQFLTGDYKGCISVAEKAIKETPDDEEWNLLLTKALLSTGQYPAANKAITNALVHEPRSVRLQWMADRKSTRLNSSHPVLSRMPSSA